MGGAFQRNKYIFLLVFKGNEWLTSKNAVLKVSQQSLLQEYRCVPVRYSQMHLSSFNTLAISLGITVA